MCHYINGGSLTVVTARELYHSTELRRINSRLNPEFEKQGKIIEGKKLNGNCYKTYQLTNIKQQMELSL